MNPFVAPEEAAVFDYWQYCSDTGQQSGTEFAYVYAVA